MKFGCTFTEYLQEEREWLMDENCAHIKYDRLKNVLKSCQNCKDTSSHDHHQSCECQSCPVCDQKFFSELMKEASDIAGYFSSRVQHLLNLHIAKGLQRYVLRLRQCFKNDMGALDQEGRILIEYISMNAIAMRKILKKYDKVHSSMNGENFKSKMHAEHIELLHSPWLIELGAFYLNTSGLDGCELDGIHGRFSCDFNVTNAVMTLTLPDSVKLEYDLTCAICLDFVFNPYALGCGHIFCKSCACSAASVMIFQGIKAAAPESKCPICREVLCLVAVFVSMLHTQSLKAILANSIHWLLKTLMSLKRGVYSKSVRMLELNLLMKRRCNDYWKERLARERAFALKQSKEYWNLQSTYAVGLL